MEQIKLKRISIVVSTGLVLSLMTNTASIAAVKAGGGCTKLGSTTTSGGYQYSCIKSGKKLIWKKGAKDSAAKNDTKSIKNSIPISLPVKQDGVITFENAADKYADIPKVAWQNVQEVIAKNADVSIQTIINIGPNTNADRAAITTGLNRLYKLFSGFDRFTSYLGIVYNAKDLAWAQTDAVNLFTAQGVKGYITRPESIKRQSEAGCEMNGSKAVQCSGGMALTFKDGGSNVGGAFYGVENTYTANGQNKDFWSASEKFSGSMTQVTHEGMHNYQFAQFFNTPLASGQNTAADQSHDFTPWWFSEGQANGIGIPVFIDNLQSYLNARDQNTNRKPDSRAKIPAPTADAMKSFLMTYQSTGPSNGNWSLAYSIGYSAVEALVAIGGPQSTLALYALGASGENWETAFKHVYGITWEQGATALGKVLAAEYSAKPLSSN